MQLAKLGQQWRAEAAKRMPEARGDIREIVGQPVFVPLFKLYTVYGKVCVPTPRRHPITQLQHKTLYPTAPQRQPSDICTPRQAVFGPTVLRDRCPHLNPRCLLNADLQAFFRAQVLCHHQRPGLCKADPPNKRRKVLKRHPQ